MRNQMTAEEQRIEFYLYINGKIICQRYVPIRDLNENITKYSLTNLEKAITGVKPSFINPDSTELTYRVSGIIPSHLASKSEDLLWDNFNPYAEPSASNYKNIFEQPDIFTFEIKVDGQTKIKTDFVGNIYPHKVRYKVNIKDVIPDIMAEMRYYMSNPKNSFSQN